MKTLKKLLFIVLCLPIIPIIGVPGEGGEHGNNSGNDNGNDGNSAEDNSSQNEGNNEGDNEDNSDDNDKLPKTMEELQRLMKKEKQSGRKAILKALGVKTVDEALAIIAKGSNGDDNQGSESNDNEVTIANERAINAERKFSLINLGCPKENIDDVLVFINAKVGMECDIDDFEIAVDEFSKKYPLLFGINPENTGGRGEHKKLEGKKQTFAERMASKMQNDTKSHYFK